MGFVSNPCLPQKASFSYPPSPVASHNNCLVCLQKKKKKTSPNWKSSWFQETGPQVARPCLRLFTGFMLLLLLQPTLKSSVLEAYLWLYVCFEIDEDVASHPATMICPFCSGIVWQMETVTQSEATKVTERCCKLSWGTPVPLLRVNPKLAFYSSLIYFLFVSMYEAARFDYMTFSSITLLPHISKRGKITWLVLVQSQHTDTVTGLNKNTQNRPQPVPSALPSVCPVAMPETTALIQHWIPVMNSQHILLIFNRERPTSRGAEYKWRPNSGSYLHMNDCFIFYCSLSGKRLLLEAEHLSSEER